MEVVPVLEENRTDHDIETSGTRTETETPVSLVVPVLNYVVLLGRTICGVLLGDRLDWWRLGGLWYVLHHG